MRKQKQAWREGLKGPLWGRLSAGSYPIIGAAILSLMHPAYGDERLPLRLCADPSNLPFSSEDAALPGAYNEIGMAIARELNRPVSYAWYKSYFGKRTVRVTLLGKECDLMVGLPRVHDFMGPAVIFSKPIATEAYALVFDPSRHIARPADLAGLRVAVQFESTPQNLLASMDGVTMVTVLSPDEGLRAVANGTADVAFVWGPVASWLNKTEYKGRYTVRSTIGDGLEWRTAIGFAKNSKDLRDQVNDALPRLQPQIDAIFSKYGLPSDPPVRFARLDTPAIRLVSDAPEHAMPQAKPSTKGNEEPAAAVAAGHDIFNGTCAHCHGPDAAQAVRRINLRLLRSRYGDDMRRVFWKTVHEGRPSKGMPVWKDVFSDDQLNQVFAYLQTIQSDERPD